MKRKRKTKGNALSVERPTHRFAIAIDNEHAVIILKRIFESCVTGDQIILVSGKDDQRIPIHRSLFAAVSKTFEGKIGSKSELILDHIDGEIIKAIVDFCYSGHIDMTEENVGNFLAAATSIQLDLLQEKCCQFYADKLSVNNSVDTLLIADKCNNANLRRWALDLICESFEVMPLAHFGRLESRLLQTILVCDKISATEECVLQRLLEWFQLKERYRKQFMPDLLKMVRLEYIPSQVLIGGALEATYKRFNCHDLVIAEFKRRISTKCSNIGVSRCSSVFSLFAQYIGDEGAEYSAIKIERYNSVLSNFEESAEIALGSRKSFEVILQTNKVYLLGGVSNNILLKSVSAYDLNSGEKEVLPEMNSARSCFTSILVDKFIYVLGGWNGMECIDACERFDTETKTWQTLKPMNDARYFAAASVVNGFIHVAGGRTHKRTPISSVEIYDPMRDEWIQLPHMNKVRSSPVLVKSNGFLYAFGCDAVVETFDPWKNCWTMIGSFDGSVEITGAIEIDDEIFVMVANGSFGKIKLELNGSCSFTRLSKSKYQSKFWRRHYLCQN